MSADKISTHEKSSGINPYNFTINHSEDYFEAEELDIMKNPDKYEVRFKCVELFRGLKEKLSK